MPSASELIAHGRSDEEVGELIGADWLIYQDLEDLVASASEGNGSIKRFECSVFDGEYVTGDVDGAYLAKIDSIRNDAAKRGGDDGDDGDDRNSQVIGIHNNGSGAS
jgi:amidophosphoribosyltransferase